MFHVMFPTLRLLNTKTSPFGFWHKMPFWDKLSYFLRQQDMSKKAGTKWSTPVGLNEKTYIFTGRRVKGNVAIFFFFFFNEPSPKLICSYNTRL